VQLIVKNNMRTLHDLPDVSGKTVFVRVDFNVPIVNGKVGDDFRIQKSFQTIDFLREKGANIILASHIEGSSDTLYPVFEFLQEKYPLVFIREYESCVPDQMKEALLDGNMVLLENLRQYPGEKENSSDFAAHLASFADLYVNEAFPAAHRLHASIVGVPACIPGFAGFVFEEEVKHLSSVLHPKHPFVFILGGAKFETKLPLVEKFFAMAETVFIGGALANDFLKAKGFVTGNSLVSKGDIHLERFLTEKLILPIDVSVKNEQGTMIKMIEDVLPDDVISDVGPQSISLLTPIIQQAQCILWNGPLGNYELGFKEGTLGLAKSIAESSGISVVGGGDTVASISELGLNDSFTFISTAGGAMLDFLAKETLPGIVALQ
jgi:phosphoglycerate kinase